ncbi:bacterial SH3 domain protein [Antarctobacter heliothermus]|uniref:Bacterial SH3 domain protein n=1 Tax=Antarctobacter heliothermus TaxID=74033 RepID=A0A222E742_9RHOB|nr:SH3 domain-containing protein [Antarctobacter heliothermus]ASP21828.1 bacterial SH3 domain protein [Antarctobacter heliothermus]
MKTFLISATLAAAALTASIASADQAWVGQNHLNYRTGPGLNYAVAGTFQPCHVLDTYDRQYGWVQVLHQGQYYWVHQDYVVNHACTYTAPQHTYTPPKPTYTPPKKTYTPPKKSGGYGGSNY